MSSIRSAYRPMVDTSHRSQSSQRKLITCSQCIQFTNVIAFHVPGFGLSWLESSRTLSFASELRYQFRVCGLMPTASKWIKNVSTNVSAITKKPALLRTVRRLPVSNSQALLRDSCCGFPVEAGRRCPDPSEETALRGVPNGARTRNLMIHSQALCRLSYRHREHSEKRRVSRVLF
jgi:hypothetical protein